MDHKFELEEGELGWETFIESNAFVKLDLIGGLEDIGS